MSKFNDRPSPRSHNILILSAVIRQLLMVVLDYVDTLALMGPYSGFMPRFKYQLPEIKLSINTVPYATKDY